MHGPETPENPHLTSQREPAESRIPSPLVLRRLRIPLLPRTWLPESSPVPPVLLHLASAIVLLGVGLAAERSSRVAAA